VPTYTFKDKDSHETFEIKMSYTVLDNFKRDNPNLELQILAENLPKFSDGIRMSTPGTGQPDSTFEKYVIQRMAETIPGNTIKANHKTKRPKEF
jgi:hypothetical protein